MKSIVKQNPIFFAFLFPALTDGIMTLIGQEGQTINEASPAYYFLLASPWVFVLGSLVWFIFWYYFIKRLKEPYNLFFMFLFIAGHSWGSGSWIMKIFKKASFYTVGNQPSIIFSWSLLILYFSIISIFTVSCLRMYLKKDQLQKR